MEKKTIHCKVCRKRIRNKTEVVYPTANGVQLGPVCKSCFSEYLTGIELNPRDGKHEQK